MKQRRIEQYKVKAITLKEIPTEITSYARSLLKNWILG